MAIDAGEKDPLYALLAGLTGRRLTNEAIWEAFGLSKAQFYEARKSGKLLNRADRMVMAARRLDINPVELLVELVPGITVDDAIRYVQKRRSLAEPFLSAGHLADDAKDWPPDGWGHEDSGVGRV